MFIRPGLIYCLLATLLTISCLDAYAKDKRRYQVYLQDAAQVISIPIATIDFNVTSSGSDYQLSMNENRFSDYFLSMRPFKCMTDKVNMLCHLPYPYDLNRHISDGNLTALEYDFLFIRRKPADYGINPWNGLYYRLQKTGDDYIGQAHEVDLDILAVPPPEDEPYPIKAQDLHPIDEQQLWLPRLLIKAQ